ncbi:MAG: transposase [Candidatus Obscuribacterales bacterium]
MTQKKKTKPDYSWTFRKQAVEQYRLSGKSAAAIAQSLNIPDWKMRLWIKEFAEQAEKAADIDELERLRAENKRLKEDNDFLKKAAAYFAKENQ